MKVFVETGPPGDHDPEEFEVEDSLKFSIDNWGNLEVGDTRFSNEDWTQVHWTNLAGLEIVIAQVGDF